MNIMWLAPSKRGLDGLILCSPLNFNTNKTHINPRGYIYSFKSVLSFSCQTDLNIKLPSPFFLVILFGFSFSFTHSSTSFCPRGDISPSPTQQMVKVEHLTGRRCTSTLSPS